MSSAPSPFIFGANSTATNLQSLTSSANFLEGYTTTATAAGTTTLTQTSNYLNFFTGSTTQTVVLPVASTLVLGQQFLIVNNSSGNVTVQSSGANNIQVMTQNTQLLVTCILTSGTGTASWSASYTANLSAVIQPTIQKFTSGTAQTYTTPTGVQYIKVRMVGGGGGGGGAGTGSQTDGGTGGVTTFGTSLLTANGGVSGAANNPNLGGIGGTATISAPAIGTPIQGGTGAPAYAANTLSNGAIGGNGASSFFGGSGGGSYTTNVGGAAIANSGSGGGGAGTGLSSGETSGAGGGAGGYVEAIITSPSATYTYSVGAAGTAGGAGTAGSAGGLGGSGYIEVTEYYSNYAVSTTTSVSANTVLAGPSSGSTANPTFRSLVAADFPGAWTAWAPTIASTGGTITTVGAVTARYQQFGKAVFISVSISITTNGTGSASINVSLPFTANSVGCISGRENVNTGKMLQGWIAATGTNMTVLNYDNTYPATNGTTMIFSGVYESQ